MELRIEDIIIYVLGCEKPTMLRKLISTLTSSDANSMNSRNFTYFYISNVQWLFLNIRDLTSIENYVRVIVFAPNL